MKQSNSKKAKISLERYLHSIEVRQPNAEMVKEVGDELIRRMLFYARRSKGLHLHWNKPECVDLFQLTIEELNERKGNDPLLNNAYDVLKNLNARSSSSVKKSMLDMAERILEGRSSYNTAISKGRSRNRSAHPLKKMLRDVISKNPRKNHVQHTDILLQQGCVEGLIDTIEHSSETVYFKDAKTKPVKFSTIRDWFYQLNSK